MPILRSITMGESKKIVLGIIAILAIFACLVVIGGLCIVLALFCNVPGRFDDGTSSLGGPAQGPPLFSYAPAANVTLESQFHSYSSLSYNNVLVYRSTSGNVDYGAIGTSIMPSAHDERVGDRLHVALGTDYTIDDTFTTYPAREYIGLPDGPSYDISIGFPESHKPGNARLQDVSVAAARVTTGNGIVKIANCSFGRLFVRASRGIAADYSAKVAEFEGTGGPIELVVGQRSGNLSAVNDEGSIKIWLPRGPRFTIDARSELGRVYCDIPGSYDVKESAYVVGTAGTPGGGNLSIYLRSLHGNIEINYQDG